MLHAETGSGKTLAMLLPAFRRAAASPEAKLLLLSPTRELAAQLADEAASLLRDGALGTESALGAPSVSLVAPGHAPKLEQILEARVVVATPPELCLLLAEPGTAKGAAREEEGDEKESAPSAARMLSDCLAEQVSVLILDEVDSLVPGLKDFRGKRHFKWMDKGMHPAEGVVKMLMRRSRREDLQVIGASATLDRSTRKKMDKLVRSSPTLREADRGRLGVASTMAATGGGEREAGRERERMTLVPEGIEHSTRTLEITSTTDGTACAVEALGKLHAARAADGDGASLVFVSSRSTYLGGAHAVATTLRAKGLDAVALSDALCSGAP